MNRYRPWIAAALAVSLLTGCGAVEEKSGIAASAIEQIAQSSEEASPLEEEITTADTSGMDFDFDESDTQEAEASTGTALEITEETTKTASTGEELYSITAGGTYTLSGTIRDVMVTVDANNADVNLILNGADIQNSTGPAIYIREADKVTITLAEGTTNTISDGASYSITDSGSTLDAAIFSKADLTINGSGALTVQGSYKHGIVSKDDLVISSGTLKVTAKNVGLGGKDCVKINSGNLTINAGSDGIRSDNDEDASRGYVYLYGGTIGITAGNDGIQAETVVNIENVDLTVKAGGGSGASLTSSEESYKGIKAGSDIYITGGSFSIDSLDDCIHSNGTITLSGGTLSIRANGDGLDANGTLSITGGTITVVGPTSGDTAILDFDASGTISGGTFIGLGAASMAQNFSASSTQGVIMVTTGNQAVGTLVQLTDGSGNVLLSHTADQSFACVILSHPSITQGGTYTLTIGDSSTEITMTSTVYGGSGGMGGGKGKMGMKD